MCIRDRGVLGREDPQLNHKRLTCCEIPHQPPLASWDKISPHLTFQCKWSAALTQRTEFSQNVVRWKFSLIECYYYQPIVIFIISCKPGQMLCNRYIASKTYARQHNFCQNDIYDRICDLESPPVWQIAAHNYEQQLLAGKWEGEKGIWGSWRNSNWNLCLTRGTWTESHCCCLKDVDVILLPMTLRSHPCLRDG